MMRDMMADYEEDPTLDTLEYQNRSQNTLTINRPQNPTIWLQALLHKNWSHLQTLNLQHCSTGNKVCQILCNINCFPEQYEKRRFVNLKGLHLKGGNQISDQGIGRLVGCRGRWRMLEVLGLYYNGVGDDGFVGLLGGAMPKLKELLLVHNRITAQALHKTLTLSLSTQTLTLLYLSYNPLTNSSILSLTKLSLPSLNHLRLQQCFLSSIGIKFLSKGNWPALASLFINENYVGLEGLGWLAVGGWKGVQAASVGSNKMKDQIAGLGVVVVGWYRLTYNNIMYDRNYQYTSMEGTMGRIWSARFAIPKI